jgi:hypothetical protein
MRRHARNLQIKDSRIDAPDQILSTKKITAPVQAHDSKMLDGITTTFSVVAKTPEVF